MSKDRPLTCLIKIKKGDNKMKKRNISIAIALLLLIIIVTGCVTKPGGGGNNIVPIVVTFDAQGGTVSPETKEVTVGSTYGQLPTPTKMFSTFTGWFTEKTGGDKVTSSTKVTNDKNHTLYAQWETSLTTKTVTVTFDAQGGTVSLKTKEVTVGSTYGQLPTPTKMLNFFTGWATTKTGELGIRITEDSIVTNTENHTLYARWKRWEL